MRIAILGAGIIGITTAYKMKESLPNAIITVYADEYSPYTTSDVSAGYWEPFCINDANISEQNRILYVIFVYYFTNFELFVFKENGVRRLIKSL
jgi:glycine/D-amino acid oxidase-like deaminating enzyme